MLEIGMALRLKGLGSAEAIAEEAGVTQDEAAAALATMTEAGHAKETPRGHMITAEGRTWVDSLVEAERAHIDHDAMEAVYERFCAQNDDFKQLVTDWQMRDVDGEQVLNDHTDEAYDADILQRLETLDAQVAPVFADAAALAPRLARYVDRFAAALAAFKGGDQSMLTSPMKDSYHTVWFHLHEELILLCGRTRADEAAAGRGA